MKFHADRVASGCVVAPRTLSSITSNASHDGARVALLDPLGLPHLLNAFPFLVCRILNLFVLWIKYKYS